MYCFSYVIILFLASDMVVVASRQASRKHGSVFKELWKSTRVEWYSMARKGARGQRYRCCCLSCNCRQQRRRRVQTTFYKVGGCSTIVLFIFLLSQLSGNKHLCTTSTLPRPRPFYLLKHKQKSGCHLTGTFKSIRM